MWTRAWLSSWVVWLASCAAQPPPAKPAPPPAHTAEAEPVREPAPDLSPVPEPEELVLVGRVSREGLAELGPVGKGLPVALGELVPRALTPLGELVEPAPVELAVALDAPESLLLSGPDVVWSVPLVSLPRALRALRDLEREDLFVVERRSPGVVAVRLRDGSGTSCVLGAAIGPAPARLVCGPSQKSIDALASYALRGLPTRSFGTEPLVIEAWPARYLRRRSGELARYLNLLSPWLGGRRGGGVEAATDVLAKDLLTLLADTRHARVALLPDAGSLAVSVDWELDEKKSWMARTLSTLPARTPGLGDLFRRLPDQSELAWFFSGAAAARADEARAAVASWLRAEWGPGVPAETIDLVVRTFVQRAPHLYAQGDAFGRDALGLDYTGRALWEQTRSTYGWHVLGFDEPARTFVPKLDQGMKNYNAGPLHDLAYQKLDRLCRGLPKIRKRTPPRKLPAGSALYDLPLSGKFFDDCMRGRSLAKNPAPNDAIVVVMVPIGERTFIGFGPGEADMVDRMQALVSGPARATSAELALLDAPDVRLGGFVSLAGVGGLLRFVSMREHWDWRRSRLSALPQRGATRAPFTLSVSSEGSTLVRGRLVLPPAFLKDLERM
ncbi:MAG: hypothetical protein U0263_15655 [Polyangiaceae bacterium]